MARKKNFKFSTNDAELVHKIGNYLYNFPNRGLAVTVHIKDGDYVEHVNFSSGDIQNMLPINDEDFAFKIETSIFYVLHRTIEHRLMSHPYLSYFKIYKETDGTIVNRGYNKSIKC